MADEVNMNVVFRLEQIKFARQINAMFQGLDFSEILKPLNLKFGIDDKFAGKLDNLNRKIGELKKTAGAEADAASSNIHAYLPTLLEAAGAALFNSFQAGRQYVSEYRKALADLRQETKASTTELELFQKQAQRISDATGVLTIDVVKSAAEWSKRGYSVQQSQHLAQQSLIYQNTAGINSAGGASNALQSAIDGFGIEVDRQGKNVEHVVDVYTAVGRKFAISSAEIGQAVALSAASLKNGGNSFEQSVGLVAAASESIADPQAIGDGLNTVAERLQGLGETGEYLTGIVPELEAHFNRFGLTLKNDEGSYKSTYEILKQLSGVWGEADRSTQKNMADLIGGKEQAGLVRSLLENFQAAEAGIQASLNAVGSAARENEAYLGSTEAKIKNFSNSINEFWQSNIDSVSVQALIDAGTMLVQMFAGITDQVGLLTSTAGIASIAFMAFNSNVRAATVMKFSQAIASAGLNIRALSWYTNLYTGFTVAARIATIALQAALTFGIGLAIAGIVSGITALVSHFSKIKQEQKEFEAQQKLIANNWIDHKDRIQLLVSELETLKESDQRYLEVANELYELMPNLAKSIDDKGKVHLKNAEAIKEELAYAEKLAENEKKQRVLDASKTFKEDIKNYNKTKNQEGNLQGELDRGIKYIPTILGLVKRDYTDSEMNQLEGKLIAVQQQVAIRAEMLRDNFQAVAALIAEQNGLEINDNVSEHLQKIADNLNMDSLDKDELADKAAVVAYFLEEVNKFGNTIVPADAAEEMRNELYNLGDQLNLTSTQVDAMIIDLSRQAEAQAQTTETTEASAEALQNLTKAQEEARANYNQSTADIKSLNQALEGVAQGQSMNAEAVANMIVKYPELASAVQQTADGWTFEKDALVLLRDAKIGEARTAIDTQIAATYATLQNTSSRVDAFGIEIQAINDLKSAHGEISKLGFVKMFGADVFDKTIFDDAKKQITIDGNTTDWSPEQYLRIKQSFADQKDVTGTMTRLGQLHESVNKLKDLMNDPTFGLTNSGSSFGGSSSNPSGSVYKPNLKIDAMQMEIDQYNRALDENNKRIDGAKATGADYSRLLSDRVKLYDKLAGSIGKLNTEQQKERSNLRNTLTQTGLVDKQGEVVKNVSERLIELSKAGKLARAGFSVEQLEGFVERYVELAGAIDESRMRLLEITNDWANALKLGLDKIAETANRKQSAAKDKISLLGEIKTEEEKNQLAKYSAEIVKALVRKRNDIEQELKDTNDKLKKATSQTEKDAYKSYIENLKKELTSTRIELVEASESIGKAQAESLAIGFEKQLEQLKYEQSLLGSIDTEEERLKAAEIDRNINEVLAKGISSFHGQILELERKLTTNLSDEERHRAQTKLDILQDYAKKYKLEQVAAVEKWGKSVHDATKNAMDAIEDFYEKQGKAEQKILDERLDAYKSFLNEQKKLFNRENDAEDYNENHAKLKKEELAIRKRISVISLDDSLEARYKREQLELELADKLEEIRKLELERSRKLREMNYDDLVEKMELETKEKKEAAEKKWQDDLAADARYSSLKEALLAGSSEKMQNALMTFSANVQTYMDAIGASIDRNLIEKLADTQKFQTIADTIQGIGSNPTGTATSTAGVSGGTSTVSGGALDAVQRAADWKEYLNNKKEAEGLKNSDARWKALYSRNQSLRERWGFPDKSHEQLKNLAVYHEGGEVGVNGSTAEKWWHKLKINEIPAILKKGEVVLNNPAGFVNRMVQTVSYGLQASLPRPSGALALSGGASLKLDKLIHIDRIENKADVDYLMNRLDNQFKAWGFVMK